MSKHLLPTVVIGAGPVGLAAAVHLRARGLQPLVLEAGSTIGAGIRNWDHVRMFSPWEYNVDPRAAALLAAHGWRAPDPKRFPTGRELIDEYLSPLAALPELSSHIHLDARVVAVTKQARDRMKHSGRDEAPFVVRYLEHGEERELLAQAVIDASGTIETANPIGAAGIPALGERALSKHIHYGIPDVLGVHRTRFAGKRVLVVGSGHSAFNVLTDLARLAQSAPNTTIHWAVRRPSLRRVLGGGENDQLAERGALGLRIAKLAADGSISVHTNVYVDHLERTDEGLVAWSGETALPPVDEIVATTGFRPDSSLLDELRLDLDAGTQSPSALAPLIDPNLHSCGTVRPHGALELKHPDANLYIVGMKSYGRAPTFLLLTGYEQVRSVAAAIAGDWESARRVELKLPETGVCSTDFVDEERATPASAGCCGGPAPADVEACCVADDHAKREGKSGCGCAKESPTPVLVVAATTTSCCRTAHP